MSKSASDTPVQPSRDLATEPAQELNRSRDAHKDTNSPSSAKRRTAAKAHSYRSRRNDADTRRQKRKQPNAQKHGIFSKNLVIPGEDPQEFKELYSALIDDWKPSGVTQEEAVFSLADLMWRKRREQRFIEAKFYRDSWNPGHVAFDENNGLQAFATTMLIKPEIAFEKYATWFLRPDKIRHLKQKFPRSNYQSSSEWAEAVINEIETVLMPATPSFEPPDPGKKVDLQEPSREMAAKFQMVDVMFHSIPLFERDLDVRDRLDGMIFRQVKYLVQLKSMQQTLRQISAK
jgi:hypothetical protein